MKQSNIKKKAANEKISHYSVAKRLAGYLFYCYVYLLE